MNVIDLVIFSSFLLVNLLIGISCSKNVTTIREYAIGNRDFNTSSIVATIVASNIGAGFFSWTLIETYRQGIYFLIPAMFESFGLIIIGSLLVNRMGEFLGKLSIAAAMDELFGKKVKHVIICMSIILSIGTLGIQFKISTKILELIFGTSGTYATILSGIIVILYSAFGGIRAVTFTDIIQFFCFGVIIPIISIIIWYAISDTSVVFNTISNNPNFNLREIFDLRNPRFYEMMFMGVVFLPAFDPLTFQRFAMSSTKAQAAKAFKISGVICLLIQILVAFTGIFILADKPYLDPDNLINYIINNYTYPGFKGLVSVGMMAMIMSSADSWINSSAVIFAHDFSKPLGFKWAKNELKVSRIFAIFIGICGMICALKFSRILDIVVMIGGAYITVVTTPFVLAIFGFRSSEKSVLIGMFAGGVTFFVWQLGLAKTLNIPIDGCIVGIITNMVFLFSSHYLLNQQGGWVGIKDKKGFENYLQNKIKQRQMFVKSILSFKFLDFCKNNLPENDNIYCYFGFFSIISIVITTFTMPISLFHQYYDIILLCCKSALLISVYFLTYPIWPSLFKNENIIAILWMFSTFFILIFKSSVFLILSKVAITQLMLFFTNVLLVFIIFRWQTSLMMIIFGLMSSLIVIQKYINIELTVDNTQLQIMFSILLSSSILIAFLKPAQQTSYKTNKLFMNAENKIKNMSNDMLNLMHIKQEFINNISHEIRTPMQHIGTGSYAIHKDRARYSEDEIRKFAENIYQSYQKAIGYINNILDFSSLNSNQTSLNFQKNNFLEIVEKTLEDFKELYLINENIVFSLTVNAQNLLVFCDEERIKQVVNNLLHNAIKYSQDGLIEIIIDNEKLHTIDAISFSIIDNGVGIPENELHNIFGPFIQSSYTKKISEGKGLGLALCERIILLHQGRIWAKNNFDKPGSTFAFMIPIDQITI